MACSCGQASGAPATEFVVRLANGRTQTFQSKVAADIAVTRHGGTIEVQKK